METLSYFASILGVLVGAFFISIGASSILMEVVRLYAQIMKNQAFRANFIGDAIFLALGLSIFSCSFSWFLTLIL